MRIGSVGIDTKGNDGFKSSIEDANNDGIPDLIVHFDRGDLVDGRSAYKSNHAARIAGKPE